eukprot:CAMPEP_0168184666 /NCGR_PEP_ID=MMETSP0139_2-20121125/13370_1 /TAXON_ID=44445 /ORGANISM="Pseudo-nitzschia australis, Strain 10249 10 AB" /LENGTH=452 /DNA_ID=CAMNT_0008106321 /DNA_START=260 /DNA_END=1618 /DNA_ORIENTATION=-
MPPQLEIKEVEEEEAAPDNAVRSESGEGESYWDAPKEKTLIGKTLSTLDMSMLEKEHPDEDKEKTDNYWEATPERALQDKTLSTLDMSMLVTEHPKESTNSAAAVKKSAPSPSPKEEPKNSEASYWDAPKEMSLIGKTLSTLDMSMLEKEHPDEEKEKKDDYWEATPERALKGQSISTLDMTMLEANNPEEHKKKKDSYWEAAPIDKSLQGKTLSNLNMSELTTSHPDEKKEKNDTYWDAPEEKKLHGKTLSTIDMTTLESTGKPSAEASAGAPSYWDDAPIDKSLQGKTLSQVDMTAMNRQHVDEPSSRSGETAPYWDWKMKKFRKTLSKLSLSNLRSGSRADDVVFDDDFNVHGGANNSRNNSSNSLASNSSLGSANQTLVKPITKKSHRIRDTWRKSFHRLSTNTLNQLDESTSSGPQYAGTRIKKSRNNLDISGGSRSSTGSDGGITF